MILRRSITYTKPIFQVHICKRVLRSIVLRCFILTLSIRYRTFGILSNHQIYVTVNCSLRLIKLKQVIRQTHQAEANHRTHVINAFIFRFATLRLRAFFLVKSYGKSYVCCNPYCDSVKNVSFTIIVYFFSKNIWLN